VDRGQREGEGIGGGTCGIMIEEDGIEVRRVSLNEVWRLSSAIIGRG